MTRTIDTQGGQAVFLIDDLKAAEFCKIQKGQKVTITSGQVWIDFNAEQDRQDQSKIIIKEQRIQKPTPARNATKKGK